MTERPEKVERTGQRRRPRRRRGRGPRPDAAPSTPQRHIIAYMPDMFFGMKVGDTAKKMGYRCYFLREVERFSEKIEELRPDLIVVDTATDKAIWTSLVRTAHQAERGLYPVIAIGRHTDLDARAAALELGAHDFVANSRFFPDMPKIIEKYARVPSEAELEADRERHASAQAERSQRQAPAAAGDDEDDADSDAGPDSDEAGDDDDDEDGQA